MKAIKKELIELEKYKKIMDKLYNYSIMDTHTDTLLFDKHGHCICFESEQLALKFCESMNILDKARYIVFDSEKEVNRYHDEEIKFEEK